MASVNQLTTPAALIFLSNISSMLFQLLVEPVKLRFITNQKSEQRPSKPVQKQQCQARPQAGSKAIVSGGHCLVDQIEAQYPENTVAGYIVS